MRFVFHHSNNTEKAFWEELIHTTLRWGYIGAPYELSSTDRTQADISKLFRAIAIADAVGKWQISVSSPNPDELSFEIA